MKMPASVNTAQLKKAQNRLINNASQVVVARLSLLPWQWFVDPESARKETINMFSEKTDALIETQIAIAMLPMTLWVDFLTSGLWLSPTQTLNRATTTATRELFKPAQSRVSKNLKRLVPGDSP